jgi:adenosylmethionine---8-amino-7-oxononanoate aminotransferase
MTPENSSSDTRHWDRTQVWHSFTQMAEYEPWLIERGEGNWLIDDGGRRYLDGVSSLWCNVHGHNHPRINAAIQEQLGKIAHVTSLGMGNSTTARLAHRLVEKSPASLQHVFFSSDGASAVEVALKLAFQYWRQCESPQPQRTLFLALGQAYHGDTLGSVSVGGVSRFHAMFDPLLFDVVRGPCPDSYRVPQHLESITGCDRQQVELQLTEYYLAAYEQLLREHGDRIAALIVEPLVQGAAGMIMHPPGFLHGLRELTRRYGTLMIVDEIATGFGRTGTLWACEQEDVQPDLLCAGKGLSGGYLPISATLTSTQIWNSFLGSYEQSRSFFHGHTFGGNPLAAAAAMANLELFDSTPVLAQVADKAQHLQQLLEPLRDHPHVGDVRQRGLIAAVELVSNKSLKSGYPWEQRRGAIACRRAIEAGVWLRPLGNVIVIMPPLSVTHDELDLLVQGVTLGIAAATEPA